MKNILIKWGIIIGLTSAVIFLLAFTLGQDLSYESQEILGWTGILISAILVVMAIIDAKTKVYNGNITYWQCVKVGVLVALIPSFMVGSVDVFYTTVIKPDFYESYKEKMIVEMEKTMSNEKFEKAKIQLEEDMKTFGTPLFGFILMFLNVFFLSLIASLISGFFIAKSKKE